MQGRRDQWLHDAFLSYSTLGSAQLGAALEHALEDLGRRWDEPRARDVFRDLSDQPATGDLATDLLRHLEGSRYLVYVVSPRAAASTWVTQEVRHWLTLRGSHQLLLVVGAGMLRWDASSNRFDEASTLPADVRSAFPSEPKWVDLTWTAEGFDPADERFLDAVADLAAAIDDVPKATLTGRHQREHRKALAHRLAVNAQADVGGPSDLALLVAAAASDLDDTPTTRRALASVLESTSGTGLILGADTAVTAIGEAADVECFLVGYDDGSVERWRGTERLERHQRGDAAVMCLAQDARGARWVVGHSDGTVLLLVDGKVLRRWQTSAAPVALVAVHTSDDTVAVADRSGDVLLLTVDGNRSYPSLIYVRAMRFVGTVLQVFAWSDSYEIDLESGDIARMHTLPVTPRPGPAAIASRSYRSAWCQLDEGGIGVVSLDTGLWSPHIQGPQGFFDAVAMDPPGQRVAVVSAGEVLVYDADVGGAPLRVQRSSLQSVRALLVGDAATWVVTLGEGRCELHLPRASTLCRQLAPHVADVPSVARGALDVRFTPDGTAVAAAVVGFEQEITLWETITGSARSVLRELPPLTVSSGEVDQLDRPVVERLPDGRGLVVRRGPDVVDHVEHSGSVHVLWALSEDGTRLAITASRGVLTVRDVEAGLDLWSVALPQFADLAFSRAGDVLAGVTGSGRLVLLNVLTGELTARLTVADAPVHRLRFDPTDKHLAVACPGGPLALVDVDVAAWRVTARRRAGRVLTPTERAALGLQDLRV